MKAARNTKRNTDFSLTLHLRPLPKHDNTGFMPNVPLPTPRIRALLGAEVHQPRAELQRQSRLHEITLHQPNTAPQGQRAGRAYLCPFCPLEEQRDTSLVQHCLIQHAEEVTPAVRPTALSTFTQRSFTRHTSPDEEAQNEEEDEEVRFRRHCRLRPRTFERPLNCLFWNILWRAAF
ncbi:hypothetical protein AOLI_G00105420 [Acnodon oligacanthus]